MNPIIVVYNSQLAAFDIPEDPPASSSAMGPAIQTFTAEDSISNETMYTERMDALKDGVNALTSDSLDKGALNHNHLKGPVIWAGQATDVRTTNRKVITPYPGYDRTELLDPTHGGMPGPGGGEIPYWFGGGIQWDEILTLDVGDPKGGLDVHSEKCFLVVMANVHLKEVDKANYEGDNNVLATFALGYRTVDQSGGDLAPTDAAARPMWFVPPETICHISNSNQKKWNDGGFPDVTYIDEPIHADVPLMWIVDMTKRPTGSTGMFGNYVAQPPKKTDGTLRNFKSLSILCSITPKGGDADSYFLETATTDAFCTVRNSNISAFLVRY